MGEETKKYGLLETPYDKNDFPFEKVFGSAKPQELPKEFIVSEPLGIKDQGPATDMCTAYAVTACSEEQEGEILNPFYVFGRTKEIMGGDRSSWGADLRSAAKAITKYGAPSASATGFDIKRPAIQQDRDRAVQWEKITREQDLLASAHKKASYFSVGQVGDVFDGMRSAVWQNRVEKRSIFTGIDWSPIWNDAIGGIIKSAQSGESYGHAINIDGWEVFNNEPYLVAQLSNGEGIGDKGIFRLSRQVINLRCKYGSFSFSDMPKIDALYELKKIGMFRYWFKSIFL